MQPRCPPAARRPVLPCPARPPPPLTSLLSPLSLPLPLSLPHLALRIHRFRLAQGNFVKGEERIGSITGAWDGTVAVDVGQSKPQELFSNSDTFRKRRLRRRLVPVEQQKSFEDQAAFFDSEITWMDVATNLKRQNYPAAASARNAVTKACPQGGAPVFFSEVEIEEGGSRWSYQHASMSAAWNNDSDCYVCERDGVISTLNKDMIGDQMAAAGVGGAAMSPDLSVFSPAMSAVRGGAIPNRRQSRLNTDESLYDVSFCRACSSARTGFPCVGRPPPLPFFLRRGEGGLGGGGAAQVRWPRSCLCPFAAVLTTVPTAWRGHRRPPRACSSSCRTTKF